MIKNTKSIYILPKEKKDFWTNENVPKNELIEIQKWFNNLLVSGYTIYNVTTEGGYGNLYSKAKGKYICVNQYVASNYTFTESYIRGAGGSVEHDDVIVSGIKLDNYLNVISYNNDIKTNFSTFSSTGYKNKVTVIYATYNQYNESDSDKIYEGILYRNSIINFYNLKDNRIVTIQNYNNTYDTFVNCYVKFNCATDINENPVTGRSFIIVYNNNTSSSKYLFNNCYVTKFFHNSGSSVYNITGSATLTYYINSINTKFDNFDFKAISSCNYTFTNCYLNGLLGFTSNIKQPNQILYTGTGVSRSGYSSNVQFINSKAYQQFIDGYNKLDNTTILNLNTTSVLTSIGELTEQRRTDRKLLRDIVRQYININLKGNIPFNDDYKKFDKNTYWLLWRNDIESQYFNSNLESKHYYIDYTGRIYYAPTNTTITFNNTDSFLIQCMDYQEFDYYYFAWHNGNIYSTIYSDILPTSYIIKRVFQILEMPDEVSYRNVYNITDSPIESNLLLQDITNKVIK